MRNPILIILTLTSLASCSKKIYLPQIETKDSVIYKEKTIYKDTTIYKAGDTIKLSIPTNCPDQPTVIKETPLTRLTTNIKNGILKVECLTKPLEITIDSLKEVIKEKESYKQTTITKTITVKEPKPYIPKWVWWSLAINIVLLYLKFKNPIFKLIEYYKK